MTIAPDTAESLLVNLARFEIEAFERSRAVAPARSPEVAAQDLAHEAATQETLRRALLLCDREIARQPLRHVAAQLGVALDEDDQDWTALAYEATKVLLDVTQERARRQQGHYDQPTIFFRRATATSGSHAAGRAAAPLGAIVAPASLACLGAGPAPVLATAAFATTPPVAGHGPAGPANPDAPEEEPAAPPVTASGGATPALHASTSLTQVIVPAGLDLPEGYDEESWQRARIAARPPRILVDRTLLSDGSRAALAKQRGITLAEAIELYYELVSWGYRAPFSKHQKRRPIPEKLKDAIVEERLCGLASEKLV